jgi:hypothetical protein
MKILYSAGRRRGAGFQLYDFLSRCKHEVRTAAYLKSSFLLKDVDLTLDAVNNTYACKSRRIIREVFGNVDFVMKLPLVEVRQAKILLGEIEKYGPDLIISDAEPIIAVLARKLGVRLWYCSPIHLLDGVAWENDQLRYEGSLFNTRNMFRNMPEPDRAFVYSPFGDVIMRPTLNAGYEWIRPYHHENINCNGNKAAAIIRPQRKEEISSILKSISFDTEAFYDYTDYKEGINNTKWMFSCGDTRSIATAVYGGINRICASPTLNDAESMLNAALCRVYGIGDDVGQIEYMKEYAAHIIEKSFEESGVDKNYLSVQKRRTLDEEVEELSKEKV